MNLELEGLIKALDAFLECAGNESAGDLWVMYQSLLEDVLARKPGLSRDRLHDAIRRAHQAWRRAQEKPPTLPPKA